MISYWKENVVIKNTSGETYCFYLDEENKIKYNKYSIENDLIYSSTLNEDKILDFSTEIDKNDKIHLLCITSEGKLVYYLYSKSRWSESILTKFDIKSNKYKHLSLKISNNSIHIFFSYSNMINPSVWTIQHIIGNKNNWKKYNVISMNIGKFPPFFHIDFDKFDNVHMIYKAKSKSLNDEIYYTFYNSLLKKWNPSPQQISEQHKDSDSPYIFIDTKDNVHIVWLVLNNSNQTLTYKHLPSIGNYKFKWKSEHLPIYDINITNPIIFERLGKIKIMFASQSTIKSIVSSDDGFTWTLDTSETFDTVDSFQLVKYSSNYILETSKTKINDLYIYVNNPIIQLPNDIYEGDQNFLNISNISEDINSKDNDIAYNYSNNIDVSGQYVEMSEIDQISEEENPEANQEEKATILKNLDEFNCESIKEFVSNSKVSLDSILSKEKEINAIKTKIEKMIYDNSLCLDKEIKYYKGLYKDISDKLLSIENILVQCRNENKTLKDLIESVDEVNSSRVTMINNIDSQINQIKDIINTESSPSILKKILSVFKKDI
ncbi:hypothetical protein [Brassicibacter mesophilus]|uniref:hypothetical protein n=1 Tax=Brassicibacter mesophilus TaxID=745119 RepID=UPI003D1F7BC2